MSMRNTYLGKTIALQQKVLSKAASVLDSSSQSESLQRKADMANNAAQRAEAPRPNNTGMPDNLKAGIENLSGFSMDNVRVHYNSSKPATVQALAYTQGTDIHVAPGQEKCLPHEAWHVAQQMAGRVSPTTNINGKPVNDNAALEHEADVMGEKAVQCKNACVKNTNCSRMGSGVTQCLAIQYGKADSISEDANEIAEGQNVARRARRKHDIGVLSFNDVESENLRDGENRNAEYIKDNMMDSEKIYIVSHGLPAMGNQPARLFDENYVFKDGNAVANVIKILKEFFGEKVGVIKIEACCSSLSRDTNQSVPGKVQNSLVENVAKSLDDLNGVNVTGNSGYAKGTDYGENGVSNTHGSVTELAHLSSIYDLIKNNSIEILLRDEGIRTNKEISQLEEEIKSYKIDANIILKRELSPIKNLLADYLRTNNYYKGYDAERVVEDMEKGFASKRITGDEPFCTSFVIAKNCWKYMGCRSYLMEFFQNLKHGLPKSLI